MAGLLVFLFVAGYVAILSEEWIRVNKAASALLMAVLAWMALYHFYGWEEGSNLLRHHLSDVSQVILFLLGAMVVVELVDAHQGFCVVTEFLCASSKKMLLFIVGLSTFFLSAVLDNLTTTIVMLSLLRKILPEREDRLRFGALVVIAANAGGAWTPIGDVTTTMLWIQGKITSMAIMQALFAPSFLSFLTAFALSSYRYRAEVRYTREKEKESEPAASALFFLGVATLIAVPGFHALLGLPPFLGIFLGLGVLWIVTDRIHWKHEGRQHLRIHRVLTQVDTSGILFFLGILLGIDALYAAGLLNQFAGWIGQHIESVSAVAVLIGFVSAFIDNIPLVAASLGMYSSFPTDDLLWKLLAYTAGTGGSMLLIGSAAGIVFMQLEKVSFLWYLKRIAPIALVSYLAGLAVFFGQEWLGM